MVWDYRWSSERRKGKVTHGANSSAQQGWRRGHAIPGEGRRWVSKAAGWQ